MHAVSCSLAESVAASHASAATGVADHRARDPQPRLNCTTTCESANRCDLGEVERIARSRRRWSHATPGHRPFLYHRGALVDGPPPLARHQSPRMPSGRPFGRAAGNFRVVWKDPLPSDHHRAAPCPVLPTHDVSCKYIISSKLPPGFAAPRVQDAFRLRRLSSDAQCPTPALRRSLTTDPVASSTSDR